MLKLYNYLTRKKETFKPLRKKGVGLYTCGPTVYNYAHIGNLRTYVFEDILKRALEYSGYGVKHVMNITDVDDKTIRDAKKAGKPLKEFTEFYAKEFFKDIKKLNILPADKYPRATAHIKEMIRLISVLLKKKLAYITEDGVYFNISRFKPYGKLSGLNLKKLKSGARVTADEYTKNEARDFALWKMKKTGEPSWPAPFGKGRPGWHIECSAMSMKELGPTFDIHAGAVDLLFPHHEDEIAQSVGSTGKSFVKYFVEGEHLLVDGKKMSKSLGNIYTLRDLERRGFDPLSFRYFALGAHYRTRLNFTWEALGASEAALEKLKAFIIELKQERGRKGIPLDAWRNKFLQAIENDLNTPGAISVIWDLFHAYHKIPSRFDPNSVKNMLFNFDKVLGLGLKEIKKVEIPKNIKTLIEKREALRIKKRWQEADAVRNEIIKRGFIIEDTPEGPVLK